MVKSEKNSKQHLNCNQLNIIQNIMGKYFEEDGKPRYWWGHVLLFPLYCVVIPLGLVKETVILATC